MSVDVVIPALGQTVKKGKIIEWLKKEGDLVEAGEVLLVVEAEKVSIEVEAPSSGILVKILVEVGQEIPVGTVVAVIAAEGEEDVRFPAPLEAREKPAAVHTPAAVTIEAGEDRIQLSHRPSILIIGGGPGGYMAAIKAAQRGASVALVEKAKLGGTCLHTGCMPTKSYLARAKVLEQLHRFAAFKGAGGVSLDMKQLAAETDQAVRELESGVGALLSSQKVEVIQGTGSLSAPGKVSIQLNGGETQEAEADNIIIASGSRPLIPPGLDIDGKYVHTTDTIWKVRKVPKRVLIVGTGAVGVEFASIFHSLGSKVTLIEMLPRAMPYLDEEISAELRRCLEDRGIEILTSTKMIAAEKQKTTVKAVLSGPGGENKFTYDLILIAAGRVPVTEGLNLAGCGVQVEKGAIVVNARMETTVPGIFAVGDSIGGLMLAHAAFMEAAVAVENIMGGRCEVDYLKVPNCIYSFPEVGSLGMTEEQAREQQGDISVARFPIYANGKAKVSGDTEGMVKIIADMSTGEILGAHILSDHATELIGEYALAVMSEVTIEEVARTIKGHPTLSESLTEAAMMLTGGAVHLPAKS